MLAVRVAVSVALAAAVACGDDIFARLRQALAGSENGEIAAQALARNDFASVETILSEAKISGTAEQAQLFALQGAVAFLDGKMDDAVAYFDRASKVGALGDSDRFTQAMAFIKLGHGEQATAILSDLAARYPKHAVYRYWLGKLDYDRRRYEEAVVKLREAVELDPKSARAWDSLGLAFDMQGQSEKAESAFGRAVELNRSQAHPSAWPPNNLGFLLLRTERAKEAAAALRESLRYDPKFAQAHYRLARALEKQGLDSEAVEEYRSAISLDAVSTDACYSLAMLLRKLHRGEESQVAFAEYKKRKQSTGN